MLSMNQVYARSFFYDFTGLYYSMIFLVIPCSMIFSPWFSMIFRVILFYDFPATRNAFSEISMKSAVKNQQLNFDTLSSSPSNLSIVFWILLLLKF